MAEYSNSGVQTVDVHQPVLFNESPVPCTKGLVRHRDGTGNFMLKGGSCQCQQTQYTIDFSANIAVPSTETAGAISLALTLDGSTLLPTVMTVTPAATERYFNVSCAFVADIWNGCCETVTVENVGAIPVLVRNANIIITR